jgi:hypothetical protein
MQVGFILNVPNNKKQKIMLKKNYYLKNNIYPRSLENIRAILDFYFKEYSLSEVTEYANSIHDERKWSLDKIEAYAYIISESRAFFADAFNTPSTLANLMDYAHQAIDLNEKDWKGTVSGKLRILKEFKSYLIVSGLI